MKNIAIILAGGNGERFNNSTPKQFLYLNKRRIIDYSICTFYNNKKIHDIIIVCNKNWQKKIMSEYPNYKIVIGGETRQESSLIGLNSCPNDTNNVLIHDAARPFVSNKIISESIKLLDKYEAINISIPSTETAVIEKNRVIVSIPKREELYLTQTPQSFRFKTILKAHKLCDMKNATDDIQLVYKMGIKCYNLKGDVNNIKITYQRDIDIATVILNNN